MASKELKEKLEEIMPCSCIGAYKDRGLIDPDCSYCNYVDDILSFVQRELIKARIKEQETYHGYHKELKDWKWSKETRIAELTAELEKLQ